MKKLENQELFANGEESVELLRNDADKIRARVEMRYEHFSCIETSTNRRRTGDILLPVDSNKEIPVLYLYPGLGGNRVWQDINKGNIKEVMEDLISADKIPQMAIVLPDVIMSSGTSKIDFYDFINFLAKDLIPYIEKTKPYFKKGKKHTAIAGLSLGGVSSLFNAAILSASFDYVGSFCPTPQLLPEPGRSAKGWLTIERYQQGMKNINFVYIGTGRRDSVAGSSPKYYFDQLGDCCKIKKFDLADGAHEWRVFNYLFKEFMLNDFFRKHNRNDI